MLYLSNLVESWKTSLSPRLTWEYRNAWVWSVGRGQRVAVESSLMTSLSSHMT